jgi:hypothetical protein
MDANGNVAQATGGESGGSQDDGYREEDSGRYD